VLYRFIYPPADVGWPQLGEREEAFYNEVMDKVRAAGLSVYGYGEVPPEKGMDGVRELEQYLKSREGYEFDNGAVLRDGSSFHIFALAARIRLYDSAGECTDVYRLLPEFSGMLAGDYLIVDFITGEVFDPELNSDDYRSDKEFMNDMLAGYLSGMKCYNCKVLPGPDWQIDESCIAGTAAGDNRE